MERCFSSCPIGLTMFSHSNQVEDDDVEEMVYVASWEILEFQNKQKFQRDCSRLPF